MKLLFFVLLVTPCLQAKKIDLLFRTDISHGFNAPYDSYLFDSTPVSSPQGDVAISLPYTQGEYKPSVWYKSHQQKRGEVIWSGTTGEKFSNLGITTSGDICFAHYDKDFFLKALVYIDQKGQTQQITHIPKSWGFASALSKNLDGQCVFSVMMLDGDRQIVRADFKNQQLQTIYSPENNVSYLFTPTSNFQGDVIFKLRYGDKGQVGEQQPDELLKWNSQGLQVLLSDKDADQTSTLYDFSHLISFNSSLKACFYANNYQQLYVLDNKKLKQIPLPEGEIELFRPSLNSNDQITLRHKRANKHQISTWNSKSKSWQLLIAEGDTISGDQGPLTISAIEGPAFAGGLSTSDKAVFVQVRFKDHRNVVAGSGLLQIEL